MLHVNRNIVGRSVVHKIIFGMTRVNKVIHLSSNQLIFMEWLNWSGLSHFNRLCSLVKTLISIKVYHILVNLGSL